MASDSDNDFEDTFVPQSTDNNNPPINVTHGQVNSDGKTVRGKDLIWKDFDQFDSAEDLNSFDLRKRNLMRSLLSGEIMSGPTHGRDYAYIEIYTCKFADDSYLVLGSSK